MAGIAEERFFRAEEQIGRPFRKLYFSTDMISKCESLALSLEAVLESDGKDEVALEEYKTHLRTFNSFDWCSTWDGRKYDIVFYGVSGYTGYLMMEYLKRVSLKINPEEFTFAFAGRTVSKVEDMRDQEFAGTKWADTPVLQMSFDDVFSIIDLCKSARVIINVAGPYMLTQGEVLVDACVHMGVHYCDISGEIPWTLGILDLHRSALEAGVKVIPSAASAGGYPDMGVFLCAKQMREEHRTELRHAVCYNSAGGAMAGSSGGTLKTRDAMARTSDEVRARMADPFALGGFVPDYDRWGMKNCSIEFGTGKVTPKVRPEDMDANMAKISEDKRLGIWRGPFVYSYFDTRIVRRSNMLLADLADRPYGRSLNFMEYSMLPTEAILSQLAGTQSGGGAASAPKGMSAKSEKAALEAAGKYYKEGEGPPLEELDDAWVGYFFWAEDEEGHEVKCNFIGRDGYFETARFAIETAMCLLFDTDELPFRGGVLTPTVACGELLAKRLINSGAKFKMGEWFPPEQRRPPPNPV